MEFIAFSDTHGRHEEILLDVTDLLIFAGDHHCRYEYELANFLEWYSEQPAKHKIFVPGNHDWYCQLHPEESRQLCKDNDIIYLCDEGVTIEGIKIWGSPVTPEFCSWAFMKERGKQLELHWQQIPDDTDILITHGPPYGILDRCPQSQGCEELLKVVAKIKPRFHIFGHIHEDGLRYLRVDKTYFMNVSVLDGRYELIKNPPLRNVYV